MWNHPSVNAWKETVLHRKVPRHCVNGKPIRTSTERFQIEPFQSPRVNAAIDCSLGLCQESNVSLVLSYSQN